MEDALIAILESFKYPVDRQGSMSADAKYPETFITFWNNETPDTMYYDNKEHATVWNFNVFVYSSVAAKCYSLLNDIRTALKAAGWIVPSHGFDAASDEETHIGRGLEVYYLSVQGG